MKKPLDILKQYWGYDQFRPLQQEIAETVIQGNDCLALLPTGGGKSVCFQVPALCMEGVCVVVSPLIALMKDQVQNLQNRQIPAYSIYSGMSIGEIDRIFDLCVNGHAKFLYLSPERLGTEIAIERISKMKVNLFAVDEAHCISQLGYDFRPSYHNIAEIRELHPKVPVIALTATATEPVVEDIQERLGFRENRQVFQMSYARSNLSYSVLQEENKRAKLLDILQKVKGTAVVYVLNRRETRETASFLRMNGISADYYHAGLSTEQRSERQDAWIQGKIRVIVATNAFGMGIDKANVRVVVHLTLPDSLEAYFQEAGRAGRDGKKAYAVLLYNATDKDRLEKQYEMSFPPFPEIRQVYRALGSYFQLAIGSAQGQSFDFDLTDFSRKYSFEPLKVMNALRFLVQGEYIELSDNVYFPSTLMVTLPKETLYDYMLRNKKAEKIIKTILRMYQGVANQDVNIREGKLANFLKIPAQELVQMLIKLDQERIIRYKPQKDVPQLTFVTERLNADDLVFDRERYEFLKNRYLERMQAALNYANLYQCRSQLLLAYFAEKNAPKCGICDICLGRHQEEPNAEEFEQLKKQIQSLLSEKPCKLSDLINQFAAHQQPKALSTIDFLLDNEFIQRNEQQILKWVFVD